MCPVFAALTVGVQPVRPGDEVGPGKTVGVTATVTDHKGLPVRGAEVTVIVVDESGNEHHAESGTIDVNAWADKHLVGLRESVVDGQWTHDLDPSEELFVTSAELGGRWACATTREDRLTVPESGLVTIRLRWPPTIVLPV